MDECPICGKVVQGNPDVCPACGAPLQMSESSRKEAEEAIGSGVPLQQMILKKSTKVIDDDDVGGFGKICLVLGMGISVLQCLFAVIGGIYLMVILPSDLKFLGSFAILLGFCLSVAQYVVFRKVHEIYDFRPESNASNK